jgi:hypothetical protein
MVEDAKEQRGIEMKKFAITFMLVMAVLSGACSKNKPFSKGIVNDKNQKDIQQRKIVQQHTPPGIQIIDKGDFIIQWDGVSYRKISEIPTEQDLMTNDHYFRGLYVEKDKAPDQDGTMMTFRISEDNGRMIEAGRQKVK